MDAYEGPGGWDNIGMNPFAAVQGKLKGMLEKDKKASKKAGPAAPEPEPVKTYDPYRRGIEQAASGTQRSAETVQRNFMTRVIKAVEPVQRVSTLSASTPRQFDPSARLSPGQGTMSRNTPAAAATPPVRRIRPGRGLA